MRKTQTVRTTWELWSYDVWGNATDGYEVNDRSCFNRAYDIAIPVEVHNPGTEHAFRSAHPSDRQIRQAFGIRCRFETDGDAEHIYIARERDGYPLGEMHCTSHASLSPIRPEPADEAAQPEDWGHERLRTWADGPFRLALYDTGRTDRYGKAILAYRCFHADRLLFEGEDFHCSPLHAPDSDQAVAALLSFLSLRPGDTDREYFATYTPEQLGWAQAHGEELGSIAHDLEEQARKARSEGGPGDEQPQEGDYVTHDHIHWHRGGRLVLVTADRQDPHTPAGDAYAQVKAHMDQKQYWPSAWFLSDHGNAQRINLDG